MDNKISNLAAKRLISEYTFLQSDDSYKKELIDLHKEEFLKRISEKSPKKDSEEPDPKAQEKKDSIKPEDIIEVKNEKTKDKIKKVYRSIVKKTHPDKVKDERLIELYMRATEAHIMNNLFELYLVCVELNIQVDFEEDDFNLLIEIIETKKKELQSIEKSFIWLFLNAPTEEEKDKIVDIYINRYFS